MQTIHKGEIICSSLEETDQLAVLLAKQIEPGDILALRGELGSGKTTFTRSVSNHFGITPELVSSPTFIYMHTYTGKLPIHHYDLYRLSNEEQFFSMGLDEHLFQNGISIIEWPDIIEDFLPERKTIIMDLTIISEETRKFEIRRKGYDITL